MAIENLDRKELEQKLEAIITQLEKNGLIPALSVEEKKKLTLKVTETLISDPKISLSKEDLKNESVEKSLGLACMAELIPNNKFDYKILFKRQFEIKPEELQHQLKLLFTDLLKLHPNYQNKTQKQQLEMEAEINQLAEKLAKPLEDNKEPLHTNDKVLSFIEAGIDLVAQQKRILYGADKPGEVSATVTEVTAGEQYGSQNLATSGGASFMGNKNNPEPGAQGDSLSLHFLTLINMLTDGNTTAYEQYLENKDIIPGEKHATPNPFKTKPTPFNNDVT